MKAAVKKVKCSVHTDIISYWLNESGNTFTVSNPEFVDKVHLKVCFILQQPVTEGLKVVRVQMGKDCVWRSKQQMSTNNIDTIQGNLFFFII